MQGNTARFYLNGFKAVSQRSNLFVIFIYAKSIETSLSGSCRVYGTTMEDDGNASQCALKWEAPCVRIMLVM